MSSTPLICCSSGVATDCSMVSASAPGYCAVTSICGGTICGNSAIGRPPSATTPPSTVTMAMTIATIGRRMKKRDITAPRAAAPARLRWTPRRRRRGRRPWCRPAASARRRRRGRRPAGPTSTIQREPLRRPIVTVRTSTAPSALTTRTWWPLCSSVTARCGTSSALASTPVWARTRPNWPGRSRLPGLGNVALRRIVPIFGSTSRSTATTVPRRA